MPYGPHDWYAWPEIGLPALRVHPAWLVTPESRATVEAWRAWNTGMGAGALPFAGGTMEQPECTFRAFAILSDAEAALKKARE